MVSRTKAREAFEPWLKDSSFTIVDTRGVSGRLLIMWTLSFKALSSYSLGSSIIVELKSKLLGMIIKVLNLYGPHAKQNLFWDSLVDSRVVSKLYLIVGGDLNITLSLCKVWGGKCSAGPIARLF